MYAENFFITLYDEERQLVNWPYYRDVMDVDLPDPNKWDAIGTGEARGVTAWMLRTGRPQLVTYERFTELLEQKEVELRGVVTGEATWVGVPLHAEGKAVGALVVQSIRPNTSTPSRTETCSRSWASTSGRPSPARGRSRRPGSATPSSR